MHAWTPYSMYVELKYESWTRVSAFKCRITWCLLLQQPSKHYVIVYINTLVNKFIISHSHCTWKKISHLYLMVLQTQIATVRTMI